MAATQKAIVVQGPGVAKLVHDRPLPKLPEDHLLVKTVAVALNPTDWKHVEWFIKESGPLLGCDYAGIVEEVGSKVTKDFKKGDRVCGFVHGANAAQHEWGTFAEHIIVKSNLQIKVPDNFSFEEASTLGVGITTVGQGLYQKLGLALPTSPVKEPTPLLVYGGSTATGTLGIQFAKLSGYTVITTCSPHNFDLVKSLGADAVFDYKDPECAKKIREFANNKLTLAWDAISLLASAQICADALSSAPGGKYATVLPVEFSRKDVEMSSTLGYTTVGADFELAGFKFPASKEDAEHGEMFWELAKDLLDAGKLKPHPLQVENTGLEGVLDGLKAMQEDKINGKKLVFKL